MTATDENKSSRFAEVSPESAGVLLGPSLPGDELGWPSEHF